MFVYDLRKGMEIFLGMSWNRKREAYVRSQSDPERNQFASKEELAAQDV